MDAGGLGGELSIPDDFKIKGAASRASSTAQLEAPVTSSSQNGPPGGEVCAICLDTIEERAVAAPCNHLSFDFLCLVSWLQEQSTCPLCKATITEAQYDWRSPTDYKTYHVPQKPPAPSTATGAGRRQVLPRRPRAAGTSYIRQWNPPVSEDAALERRKHIYRNQLYCLHVGANRISSFRNFTYVDFASSAELQTRARMFIRRELLVFSFLHNTRGNNADFLLEYVIAVLETTDLKDAEGKAEDLLREFLGRENARLFLHELDAFLRSPYGKLGDWDRHAQYADSRPGSKRFGGDAQHTEPNR